MRLKIEIHMGVSSIDAYNAIYKETHAKRDACKKRRMQCVSTIMG